MNDRIHAAREYRMCVSESLFWVILLILVFGSGSARAADPAAAKAAGVSWLERHQDGAGGWDAYQPYHGDVMQALNESNYHAAAPYANLVGRTFATQSPRGAWSFSNQPVAGFIQAGMSPTAPRIILALDSLRQAQDIEGGWNSNVVDTQKAVSSFIAAGQADNPAVLSAIQWLRTNQNADGGWGYAPTLDSDVSTYYACDVLARTVSANDFAIVRAKAWIAAHFTLADLADDRAMQLEALVGLGDTARSGQVAAAIVSAQKADGTWDYYPGATNTYATCRSVLALRRAKSAGIAGLADAISRGSWQLLTWIDIHGDPMGRYAQVIDTAQTAAALVSAGRMSSTTGARLRFESVLNDYYYYDFVFNGGCFEGTGWGLFGLARIGGEPGKIYRLCSTLFNSQAYPDGYWYDIESVTYTVAVLLGLSEAGEQANPRFGMGLDWLEAAFDANLTYSASDLGRTLLLMEGSSGRAAFLSKIVSRLAAIQNGDGGWGEEDDLPSRIDTTASVLIGLRAAGVNGLSPALGCLFLLEHQNYDGGWNPNVGCHESQTAATALAVWALNRPADPNQFPITIATDKQVYSPGETVQITVQSDFSVHVAGGTATDSMGAATPLQIVGMEGSYYHSSYTIPANHPPDRYQIAVRMSYNNEYGVATTSFQVMSGRPVNIYPYDGSRINTLIPVMRASDFDNTSGTVHASSRWQVRKLSSASDWTELVYDSGERGDALTQISIPSQTLQVGCAYEWRVQYQDTQGHWSLWSAPTGFMTQAALRSGVNWLVDHQTALGGWEVLGCVEGSILEALSEAGLTSSPTTVRLYNRLLEMEYVNGSWPMLEYTALPGLMAHGDSPSAANIALAVKALKARQSPTGSWPDYGTLSENATYATASALRALALAGEAGSPEAQKTIAWFKTNRNSDYGWGNYPGSPSHTCFTAPAVRALALALGKNDPFVQQSYTYLRSHWQIPGSWSKMEELDAIVLMGDLAYAQTSADSIVANQQTDGSWVLLDKSDLNFTAGFLSALCRAKKAGVSVPSSSIDRAVAYLSSHIEANGAIRRDGYYARIDLSAFAALALQTSDYEGTEPLIRARNRFLAHTDSGWHNYFQLTPSYGTYCSGLAAAALAGFGDSASASLMSDTATRLLAEQQTDGGWAFLSKGSSVSEPSFTATALLGLRKAGRQASTGFGNGVAWMQTAYQQGKVNTENKGWLLAAIAGLSQYASFSSQLVADLVAAQHADGGWGRYDEAQSLLHSSAAVLIGLKAAGAPDECLRRAEAWIMSCQNPDGGWGEYIGALTSDVTPTGVAVWALSEARDTEQIGLTVTTDCGSYSCGDTVSIVVSSSVADLDSIQGGVTDPNGGYSSLVFTRTSSTRYTAQFTIPADQWPGRFMIGVQAVKSSHYGAASCYFDARLNRPMNIYPSDGQLVVPVPPTLVGSNFSGVGVTHAASQWQVREASSPSDWSDKVFDSVKTADVLTSITVPAGQLRADTTYAWRVRYKDSDGVWSGWSVATTFGTFSPVSAGVNWLEAHQVPGGGWDTLRDTHAIVLEALVYAGQQNTPAFQRVRDRILAIQSAQGNWAQDSWPIPGLIMSGMSPTHPQIVLGVEAIKKIQDPAGSWYQNTAHTGEAIWSLIAAGQSTAPEVGKGIQWLKSVQNSDGGWGYAPGEPSNIYTENAYRVIKSVMGPNDPAIAKANTWLDINSSYFPYTAWPYWMAAEVEEMLQRPNLTVAARVAASLVTYQNADGSWDLVTGGPATHTTALVIRALCKARTAGIAGLDTAISKGTAYMIGRINNNGDPISAVEAVVETAQAGTALVAAGRAGKPSATAALAKFENYTSAYFSYQFISPGLCSDGQGWALLALHRMNGSSAALAKYSDNLFAAQRSSGGWEQGTWGSGLGQVGYTGQALMGLAEAGRQSDSRFVNGMNWLIASVQAGKEFTSFVKGCTLLALGDTTTWPAFRQQTVAGLLETQNDDGGWGYSQLGQPSRIDSTAAALLGLYRAGDRSIAISRARQYLTASQNIDGGWGEYGTSKYSCSSATALATLALAETAGINDMRITLTTDHRSYIGGETVRISITTGEADPDSIEGSVVDPAGGKTPLTLTKIDATHFSAQFQVPLDQWPGTYVVTVNAVKSGKIGAAARSFNVGLYRPINILPYDMATTISMTPTLKATDFDDSGTSATHAASQWQVRDIASDEDYSQTVFDSAVDATHRTSITVPIGRLRHGGTYAWSVRYKDSDGLWSAWSIETEFTTVPAEQFAERLVFDMDGDIWIMSPDGSEPVRITAGPARDSSPRLSPDGQWIAYSSDQDGPYRIWLMHPDGSSARSIGTFQSGNPITLDWNPQSDRIAASGFSDTLYLVPVDGAAVTQILYLPLTQVRHVAWSMQNKIAIELSPLGDPEYGMTCMLGSDGRSLVSIASQGKNPAWTPDGSFIAVSCGGDVWRYKADGSGAIRLTSAGDEYEVAPAWSTDAATLFYRSYPRLNPGVSTLFASASDGSRPVALKYYNASIGTIDSGVIALGSNMPPAQPALVSPADGATNISLVPNLSASAFVDPNAGDTHAASHWQVRLANESYETAVVDEVTQTELTSYAIDAGALVPGQRYCWRVCYTDNHGNVGPWSAERAFSTIAGPATAADKILIVAGGGDFTGNAIVEQTKFLAGYAYRLSRNRLVPASQIKLLSAFPTIDANNDGVNDVSAAATRQNVLAALNPASGFAASSDKLIIYMIDHGVRDINNHYFRINPTEMISAAELDQAIDALQAARPTMKIAVVFDFCYSGGFTMACAPGNGQYRICVSGSTQDSLAIFSGTIAGVSFSNFFFDSLAAGANFKCAFDAAREAVLAAYSGPPNYPLQVPWIEDDGDGHISSKFDGLRAREFYWGSTQAYGISAPQILSVTPDQNLGECSQLKLSAEIAPGYTIDRVWVTIVSPSANYAPGPITNVREVTLVREGTTRIWSAMVTDLIEAGEYRITYYARGYETTAMAAASPTLQADPSAALLVSMPRPTVIFKEGVTRNSTKSPWMLYR